MSRGRRVLSGAGVLVAVASSLAVWVEPAAALSCAIPKFDDVLERGNQVAVVTRVGEDHGGLDHYRVLAQIGKDLPVELTVNSGHLGDPQVLPGGASVAVFDRVDGEWAHVLCANHLPLAEVLDRIEGEPRAAKGGAPVAYAGGKYGGSRVVALDADGDVVAWDGKGGAATAVAVCPGGRTVVSVGHAPREDFRIVPPVELTVHDADTLRPERTVVLSKKEALYVAALRCADSDAHGVDVLLTPYSTDNRSRLLNVEGEKVVERDLGEVAERTFWSEAAVATESGFLLAFGDSTKPALAIIGPDGKRKQVIDLDGFEANEIALSPDERTVAVYGASESEDHTVRTIDLATGEVLGELRRRPVAGMGWTESGALLVRESASDPHPNLARYDRRLRETDLAVGAVGWHFTTVGDDAVSFGDTPIRVTGFGDQVEARELRLAATDVLVGVPGESFDLGEVAGDGGSGTVIAVEPQDGNAMARAVGGAAAAGALAMGAAFVVHRRRTGE